MRLSIIIPVYDEENYVAVLLGRVFEADLSELGLDQEIIVVDDCSTDSTPEILEGIASEAGKIKLFRHEKNKGKGAAIRTALHHITGDIVLIQDADLEYDPQEYPKLLRPILEGKADVVYGSRFAGGQPHRVLYFWHYVANNILTLISNALTNLNLTDMEACYKVFRSEIIQKVTVEEDRFGFEPEITAKVAKLSKQHQCRIYEVGISYSGRTFAEGKKISWKDGIQALRCMFKYNILR